MTKYRIKEYKGKFTVEEIDNDGVWFSMQVSKDTLKEAKEYIDHAIMMNQEPKYHYYPEETKKPIIIEIENIKPTK